MNDLIGLITTIELIGDKDMDERRKTGKELKGVILPVAPNLSELDGHYFDMRDNVVQRIKNCRTEFVVKANRAMVMMYWHIGKEILQRQKAEGWGARVIDRLSKDLNETFPEMKGFSSRNLKYMRKFAENFNDEAIVQQAVAQLPWRGIISLLDKVDDNEKRIWYAQMALKDGWSSNVMALMINAHLHERQGQAVTNFDVALPLPDSDMAQQMFKDPCLFDFLGTDAPRREIEIEKALTMHIEKFLLELGQGFAFVGRQVHLEVGGDDFYIDLLFYHLELRCFVVVELKACEFEPGFVAQLNMYQNIVNDVLRHPTDKPTIGLLLVKGKNKTVVEYSLQGYKNPMSVADWQEKLTKELPDELKSSLPTIEEIEKEMELADIEKEMELADDVEENDRTVGNTLVFDS